MYHESQHFHLQTGLSRVRRDVKKIRDIREGKYGLSKTYRSFRNMLRKVSKELIQILLRISISRLKNTHRIIISWFPISIFRFLRNAIQGSDASWCDPAVAHGKLACSSGWEALVRIDFLARAGNAAECAGSEGALAWAEELGSGCDVVDAGLDFFGEVVAGKCQQTKRHSEWIKIRGGVPFASWSHMTVIMLVHMVLGVK